MDRGNDLKERMPVAAGRFYQANEELLKGDLTSLFSDKNCSAPLTGLRAVISPHAGYIYSGRVAASAYASADRESEFKNIFLLGTSHSMTFDGASVYDKGYYITPLGRMMVNSDISSRLIGTSGWFSFIADAHSKEHSIEVQLPFIQYWFRKQPLIVPIIIGTGNTTTLRQVAATLKPWFTRDNLFVISSDFSHYPSWSDASEVDKATAEAILTGSSDIFLERLNSNKSASIRGLATSMCGWTAALILLYLTEAGSNLEYIHLDYMNSGDSAYGDRRGVVGYHAIAVREIKNP
ncbi:MAG: AmmeMemoRadiSam system protein B [Bacteroidales bacterium]|nr:AmmeMemoRadiSam system protein B [Bacteroidales bacterium]